MVYKMDHLDVLLRESLKMNLISNFETGNKIYDSVIRVIIIALISTLTGKIFHTLNSFFSIRDLSFSFFENYQKIYLFFKKPKKLTIHGSRYIEMKYMISKCDFSLRFKAVLNKIIQSLHKNNDNKKLIKNIKELKVRDNIRFSDNEQNVEEFNFIVHQNTYFKLEENIYCTIITTNDIIDSADKKTSLQKEDYNIEIWSPIMNCNDLLQYVEKITDEYELFQKNKNNHKRYIFTYEGKDKENHSIQWNITELQSKRTLEHIFFEGKDEFIVMIDRFIKEKEFYEKIGKPWHLGILLEGEPGCGKTSFIVGLANYLQRSIKDVKFNRMKTIDDVEKCLHCISYDNKDMSIDKVIVVAEDLDCMTDIVKSRKLIEKEKNLSFEKKHNEFEEKVSSLKTEEARALMYAFSQSDEKPIIIKDKDEDEKMTTSDLLNLLDGINSREGEIRIFTSNCPETFDEAFLRPGRIDIRIKCKRPKKNIIYKIMFHWYKCLDDFYPTENNVETFKGLWKKYENQIEDEKHRPCDITNFMQMFGKDIEKVFEKLIHYQ